MARHVDEARHMRSLTSSGPFWSWLRENPIDLIYIALILSTGKKRVSGRSEADP